MLKTIGSPDKPAPSRNNGSKSAFSRNDNSKPASRRNNGDNEVDGVDIGGNGVEHAKKSKKMSKSRKLSKSEKLKSEKMFKSRKLSKSGKSKGEKTSKSQNLAKSGKKLSKSGNSTNSDATKDKPKFLIPDAGTVFNRLQLAFTETPILWHFDPKCHIQIETDALGYTIGGVLSQLTSGTNPNGVVTKADLGQ